MYFLQEHYSKSIVEEKQVQNSSNAIEALKGSNNFVSEKKCNIKSPICLEYMEKYGKTKREELFFVFRVSDFPYPNPNYFTKEIIHSQFKDKKLKAKSLALLTDKLPNRKYAFMNLQVFDDKLALQNKMRIGRQEHICQDIFQTEYLQNKQSSPPKSVEINIELKSPKPKLKEEYIKQASPYHEKISRTSFSKLAEDNERPTITVNKNKLFTGLLTVNTSNKAINIINLKAPKKKFNENLNGNILNLTLPTN